MFVEPLEVETALWWAARNGAQVTQIEHEWVYGPDDAVTGGYVVEPGEDVALNYRLTMSDIFTGLVEDLAADPNVSQTDRQHASDIAYQFQAGSAPVTMLNVLATSSEIDSMRTDSSVLGVSSTADSTTPNGAENACAGEWWPRVGTVRTGPLPIVPRYRRVYQWFRWDAERLANLKCKHSKVTYEAEFWSDNEDRLHYLGYREGFASNLPKAYLDNEFMNPEGEDLLGFTVGSNDALRLIARTSGYYTLVVTGQGNSATDRGSVNSQWGFRRWTTWCRFGPAWCTYAGGTEPVLSLHGMPGANGWSGSS